MGIWIGKKVDVVIFGIASGSQCGMKTQMGALKWLLVGMGTTQVDLHTHLNRHFSHALHTLALISTSEFLPPYNTAQWKSYTYHYASW